MLTERQKKVYQSWEKNVEHIRAETDKLNEKDKTGIKFNPVMTIKFEDLVELTEVYRQIGYEEARSKILNPNEHNNEKT